MKIKMRTLAAGAGGVFEKGKEYDVTAEVGQPMVEGGYAELVKSAGEATAVRGKGEVESAMTAPAENAMKARVKGRGKK